MGSPDCSTICEEAADESASVGQNDTHAASPGQSNLKKRPFASVSQTCPDQNMESTPQGLRANQMRETKRAKNAANARRCRERKKEKAAELEETMRAAQHAASIWEALARHWFSLYKQLQLQSDVAYEEYLSIDSQALALQNALYDANTHADRE